MKPRIISGDMAVDDRGVLGFANDFNFKGVKRFYTVHNYPDTSGVRGWHGHIDEAKYVLVIRGRAIFILESMETHQRTKYALSGDKPEVLYIPPNYYHAYQTRTKKNYLIFFSTSTLEESKADDFRRPFGTSDLKLFDSVIR